jgi:hypothetical protein
VETKQGAYAPISAHTEGETVWVDLLEVLPAFQVKIAYGTLKYLFTKGPRRVILGFQGPSAELKESTDNGPWRRLPPLPREPRFTDGKPFITLESLAALLNQPLRYHRQKHLLRPQESPYGGAGATRFVSVRTVERNQRLWVSVTDVARAMGVVVQGDQSSRFLVVLPDFTILEIRPGQPWIYKNKEPIKRLEEPIQTFEGGAPYAVLSAMEDVLSVPLRWDVRRRALEIPSSYARTVQAALPGFINVVYEGFTPHPPRINLETLELFTQNPAPSFQALNEYAYDSVRDFTTNDPLPREGSGWDQMGGRLAGSLSASALGRPLGVNADVVKTGSRLHLSGGEFFWGLPSLQLRAAREYWRPADFTNQLDLVDQGTLTLSNDESETAPVKIAVGVRAGEDTFEVFSSTDIFSQSTRWRQRFSGLESRFSWGITDRDTVRLALGGIAFFNRVDGTEVNLEELAGLGGLTGLGTGLIPIDEINSLNSALLSGRHGMATAEAAYRRDDRWELGATAAQSWASRETAGPTAHRGGASRLRATLGNSKRKIEGSYESIGPEFRSLGNPRRYQDRDILRLSPVWDLGKGGRFYGEFRREDSRVLVREGGAPTRTDYTYASHFLPLRRSSERLSWFRNASGLFGTRWMANADHSQFFGGHSVSAGMGLGRQSDFAGAPFRRDTAFRLGGRRNGSVLQNNFSTEWTRRRFESSGQTLWESASEWTAQWKKVYSRLKYQTEIHDLTDRSLLYTGYYAVEKEFSRARRGGLFVTATSLKAGLGSPLFWRLGTTYSHRVF